MDYLLLYLLLIFQLNTNKFNLNFLILKFSELIKIKKVAKDGIEPPVGHKPIAPCSSLGASGNWAKKPTHHAMHCIPLHNVLLYLIFELKLIFAFYDRNKHIKSCIFS